MDKAKEIEYIKNQIKHLSMEFENYKEKLFACEECKRRAEENKRDILNKNEKIRSQYDIGKQSKSNSSIIKLPESQYQKMKEQDQDAIHGFSFEPCSNEHLSIQREMAKSFKRMEANKNKLIEINSK